jgi:hypothetical protein
MAGMVAQDKGMNNVPSFMGSDSALESRSGEQEASGLAGKMRGHAKSAEDLSYKRNGKGARPKGEPAATKQRREESRGAH